MRRALLTIGEGVLIGRVGGGLLDRQLFLYEVGQGLPCDVEGVETEVVVLLLLLGRGAETEGRLPVSGGLHRYSV